MSEINQVEVLIKPQVPKVIDNQQVLVYIPATTITSVSNDFEIDYGKLILNIGLERGTGTNAVQMKQDGDSGYFDFTGKNPNATELDPTLTGNIPYGATGNFAASFGGKSSAQGKRSFAAGTTTIAKGNYSAAFGDNSVALGHDSFVAGYQNTAKGKASFASGSGTQALGDGSAAFGDRAIAKGTYSAAFGGQSESDGKFSFVAGTLNKAKAGASFASGTHNVNNDSKYVAPTPGGGGTPEPTPPSDFDVEEHYGETSHTEGAYNSTYGFAAHAEGLKVSARGHYSHAEGTSTISSGESSHAEGGNTKATGKWSHSEGNGSISEGIGSHAENKAKANADYSHAEGVSIAGGVYAHAEGNSQANADYSHAEGDGCIASEVNSHAEGTGTRAQASAAHAEGSETKAIGQGSHAEGRTTQAKAEFSHAEGVSSVSSGQGSHAEGNSTASNIYAHSEGESTTASGRNSHSQGKWTKAVGDNSTAVGISTTATGNNSFAGGNGSEAVKSGSFVHGFGLKSNQENQAVFGTYNAPYNATLLVVGNGSRDNYRTNAFEVYQDGRAKVQTAPKDNDDVVRLQDISGISGGIAVVLSDPSTAIKGTLTADQLATLQASNNNYIVFNNELYYLADKQHTTGILSYTHTGWDGSAVMTKSINITISTKAWALVTGSSGDIDAATLAGLLYADDGISIVYAESIDKVAIAADPTSSGWLCNKLGERVGMSALNNVSSISFYYNPNPVIELQATMGGKKLITYYKFPERYTGTKTLLTNDYVKTLFGNKTLVGEGNIDLYRHVIRFQTQSAEYSSGIYAYAVVISSNNLVVDSITDLKTLMGKDTFEYPLMGICSQNSTSRSATFVATKVTESKLYYWASGNEIDSSISLAGVTITDTVTTV